MGASGSGWAAARWLRAAEWLDLDDHVPRDDLVDAAIVPERELGVVIEDFLGRPAISFEIVEVTHICLHGQASETDDPRRGLSPGWGIEVP